MQTPEQNQAISNSEDCAAKAAYCAWAAQNIGDPEMRRYLEDLARRWALSAATQVLHSRPISFVRSTAGIGVSAREICRPSK